MSYVAILPSAGIRARAAPGAGPPAAASVSNARHPPGSPARRGRSHRAHNPRVAFIRSALETERRARRWIHGKPHPGPAPGEGAARYRCRDAPVRRRAAAVRAYQPVKLRAGPWSFILADAVSASPDEWIEVVGANVGPAFFSGIAAAAEANPALVMGGQARSGVARPRPPVMPAIETAISTRQRASRGTRVARVAASGRSAAYGRLPGVVAPCGQCSDRRSEPQFASRMSTQLAQAPRKMRGNPNSSAISIGAMIGHSHYCHRRGAWPRWLIVVLPGRLYIRISRRLPD